MRILAANLRSGTGEIDLLVRDGGALIAVEVKARVGVDPVVEITPEKRRRLRASAGRLRPRPVRIDAVLVRIGRDGVAIRRLRGIG